MRRRTLLAIVTLALLSSLSPTVAFAEGPAQPLPAANSLGAPPVPCFPYGGDHSICPENGFQNPSPPQFMAATYYGTLEIQNHLVHVGEDVTMDAHTNNGGEPSWSTPGPVVAGCGKEELTCTWKAETGSPYPPTETSSGWKGGWEVTEIGFCGFFGCAPSGDYYYVIGNQAAISGHVLDSSGQAAQGVSVAIQGADGGVAAEVDPETGFYNALVPEGHYTVSVEQEGAGSYTFGAGTVTKCTGHPEGPYCSLELHDSAGEASFQLPLEVTEVQADHGSAKGGETIHVFGAGFTGAEGVSFVPTEGGAPLPAKSFTIVNDDEITVETPDATGALEKGKNSLVTDVEVSNGGVSSPINAPADRYTFGSQHTLTVKVTNAEAQPAAGVKLAIVSSGGTRTEGVTDEQGQYSEKLEEANYTVTPQPPGTAFPESGSADPDCQASNVGCGVQLKQDRSIKFTTCVVPKPDGSPLPANTPSPIPGAETVGNLEAVGCWTSHEDGTYTSTQPVRLDGIDVNPDSGTTITLHPDATVTSEGSASIGAGGLFALPVGHVDLDFQGATVQAADLGSANPTFGVTTSIKGIPFSLTTGSSLQTLTPPWQSSPGQTVMNLDLQLPTTLNASSWNPLEGAFKNGNLKVPSIGGTLTLTVTNREGLISPQVCAKFTGGEFKLWSTEVNTSWISQATACYDFHADQWTLTGLFKLPSNAKYANQVNVSLGWVNGWNWNSGSIQVDGINKQLADWVFLQRLGASFHRDFTEVPPAHSNFAVSAGFSFGPQLNRQTAGPLVSKYPFLEGVELFSLNGEGLLQVWSDPSFYKLTGTILMFRGSPLQAALAGGYLDYYSSGRFDFGGDLSLHVPVFHWGIDGQMSGFLDTQRNLVQLTGTDDVSLPGLGKSKAEVLLNQNALVLCFAHNGQYGVGGVWDFLKEEVTSFEPGTCDIGKYTISAPETPPVKVSSASSSSMSSSSAGPPSSSASGQSARAGRGGHSGTHRLRLPNHLAGSTIAVRGRGAPPLVSVRGPGFSLRTPSGTRDVSTKQVLLVKNAKTDTTYINLYAPRGGTWTLTALPGSAPVVSVRAALPAPRAKLHARVSGPECRRVLTYTARVPSGETVALYAQNGTGRTFLGDARSHGKLPFAPDIKSTGAGQVLALELRGTLPRSLRTIASYRTVVLTRPERVSGLRLKGRSLSWAASCDAIAYTVVIRHGKQSTTLGTKLTRITLPKLTGSYSIVVTPLDAADVAGPAGTKTHR